MFQVFGISHITFTVRDIKRECKFYSLLFGKSLKVVRDPVLKGALKFNLRSVGVPVSFREYKETPAGDRFHYSRVGLDHFALEVSDEAALSSAYQRLLKAWKSVDQNVTDGKSAGIEVCQHTGRNYVCFRDPSDLQVEFYIGN